MIKKLIQDFKKTLSFLKNGDKPTVNLIKKHILFFIILILIIIISFILLYTMFDIQKKDTHDINLSGKQRMHTQKASYLALKILHYDNIEDKKELSDVVKTMVISQNFLSKELLKKNISLGKLIENKVEQILFDTKTLTHSTNLDKKTVDDFIAKNQELLLLFDQATSLKEEYINEKIFKNNLILVILCFILIATVIVESLFIFKPAIYHVIRKNLKLGAMNKHLEQRVKKEVLIRREQEHILIQKTKEAEIGELINSIAHQWRQPITILGLYLETIQIEYNEGTLTKEDLNDFISKSLNTISYMSQTIDDFRSFFLPSNKEDLFNILDSVNRVEKLLGHILTHENIKFHKNFDEEYSNEFNLYGRRNDFEQCLMIIVNNAKDAIINYKKIIQNDKIGNITITVKSENGYILCYIEDDGGGIPKEFQSKIFEAYFSTKGSSGTGVGLYMCKNIISSSFGGDISFQTKNYTTTFLIKMKPMVKNLD